MYTFKVELIALPYNFDEQHIQKQHQTPSGLWGIVAVSFIEEKDTENEDGEGMSQKVTASGDMVFNVILEKYSNRINKFKDKLICRINKFKDKLLYFRTCFLHESNSLQSNYFPELFRQ